MPDGNGRAAKNTDVMAVLLARRRIEDTDLLGYANPG